jgi:phage-related protein
MKEQKILVLNGFIKKTQTTPRRELRLAIKRMEEVKNA